MLRLLMAAFLVLAIWCRPSFAWGQQHGLEERSAQQAASGYRWYGWATLSADVLAVSLGQAFEHTAAPAIAVAVLAPPVIHAADGNLERGLWSLLLRAGTPTLSALIGHQFTKGDEGFPRAYGAMVGGVVGYVVALAVDAAVLAYDPVEAPATVPTGPAGAVRLTVSPIVSRGAMAGVVASF